MTQKSLFVTVCGAPNAGKSTLVNHIVGAKVSIVSPKPQTTRENIKGIATINDTQFVFIDTPGIMKAQGNKRQRNMVDHAWDGIKQAELVLFVLDASRGFDALATEILEALQDKQIKGKAVINKIDLVTHEVLLRTAEELYKIGIFDEIFMTSVRKDIGIDDLIKGLEKAAIPQAWPFPQDQISDKNDRFLSAEITREKIFYLTQQEIPYGVDVEVTKFQETEKATTIHQTIFVPREAHKKIIIGHKGEMLKTIGTKARQELEKLLDRKVNLFLHISVRPILT